MLLPSAVPCEGHKYLTRSHFAGRAFSPTPPPSSDGFPGGNSLLGTCRALQSLLSVPPVSSPRRSRSERLQSPFHIQSMPITGQPSKIVKSEPKAATTPSPPPPPHRGVNKRTRRIFEDGDSDGDLTMRESRDPFFTPKRRKRAPSDLPLGLAISDFESLDGTAKRERRPLRNQIIPQPDDSIGQIVLPSIEIPDEGEPVDWTAEDDQKLVEIVLEKFKLSKRDWEECARQIGKDNDSVGKRWKALVGDGNIGLRRGRRFVRGRLDQCFP